MESPTAAMAAALAHARVPHGFVIIEDDAGELPTRVVVSSLSNASSHPSSNNLDQAPLV